MIQEVLVAVYGSLRKGMGNHGLLERNDAQLLSTERVTGWNMYSLGDFRTSSRGWCDYHRSVCCAYHCDAASRPTRRLPFIL